MMQESNDTMVSRIALEEALKCPISLTIVGLTDYVLRCSARIDAAGVKP